MLLSLAVLEGQLVDLNNAIIFSIPQGSSSLYNFVYILYCIFSDAVSILATSLHHRTQKD